MAKLPNLSTIQIFSVFNWLNNKKGLNESIDISFTFDVTFTGVEEKFIIAKWS
jgi:hypothetical protein